MSDTNGPDLQALARRWYARARAVEEAHFRRCVIFQRWHIWLGAASVVATSLLGAIANLSAEDLKTSTEIFNSAKALLSISAPVLASLVAFLKLQDKSNLHHNAAARFASIKRKMQMIISECYTGCDPKKVTEQLDKTRLSWDELTLEAPALYKKDWSEIQKYDRDIDSLYEKGFPVPAASLNR
jgi:hypothetical protein